MKVAIVSLLVCFALCVSAQRGPRPGHGRRPHPHPKKGPVTTQELSQLISSGLRHLDEALRKNEPIVLSKLNTTLVQTDSLNVTVDVVRARQFLGKTIVQNVGVKRTNSSLKLSLEVEQEGSHINGVAVIEGTVSGNETNATAPISIVTEKVTLKYELEALLGEKSVNITNLEISMDASAANVTLTGSELDSEVVEAIQNAVSATIANGVTEAQKIIDASKEKAIEDLNKKLEGKSLEDIVEEIIKIGHHGHHRHIQRQFQQLFSL